MDNQLLIEQVLQSWSDYAFKETGKTVFDRLNNRYLLLEVAWNNEQRIYDVVVHVDIIDNKFWIQEDKTPTGIGNDLLEHGIPKERIVLAFYPLDHRKNGTFAAQ
jgi:hypothetical protein